MSSERKSMESRIAVIIDESPTLGLASGGGARIRASTLGCFREGADLYCVVEPGSQVIDNLMDSPRVAITVEGGGAHLEGIGRGLLLGPVEGEPSLKRKIAASTPALAEAIERDPDSQLVKVVIDRYYITEPSSGASEREEFTTEAGANAPSPFALWAVAVRAFSFTASLIPPTVGAMLAFWHEVPTAWALFPLVLVASVSYHAGTNLVNDYYDFKNKVDRKGTLGSSGLLVQGLISARSLLVASVVFFAIGTLIGFYFISLRGLPILVLGLAGLLGGYFYTGGPISYKYRAVGEPMVFLLMGPLMVVGSYLVLTGSFRWDVVLVSLPVGCLVAAILQSNDLRDIAYDRVVDIKTNAILLGGKAAGAIYYGLVISAYAIVALLAAFKIVPVWSLAVLITFPMAAKNMRIVRRIVEGASRKYGTIDVRTAQLHMAFGLVLVISLAVGRLL